MIYLIVALKEWKLILIAILSCLLLTCTAGLYTVGNEKEILKLEYDKYVQDVTKQNIKNEAAKKAKALEIVKQQHEVEVKYDEKIRELQHDVAESGDALTSLHKQLKQAQQHSKAVNTPEAADSYSNSVSELFEDCSARYAGMAETADKHRLAEGQAVESYNKLVDELNKE